METSNEVVVVVCVVKMIFNELSEETHNPRDEQHVQTNLNLLFCHFILNVFSVPVIEKQSALIKHDKKLENKRVDPKRYENNQEGHRSNDFDDGVNLKEILWKVLLDRCS